MGPVQVFGSSKSFIVDSMVEFKFWFQQTVDSTVQLLWFVQDVGRMVQFWGLVIVLILSQVLFQTLNRLLSYPFWIENQSRPQNWPTLVTTTVV
jgi:hypothetical protein